MAMHADTTAGRTLPPLEIIDLDRHPDGALLRVCAALGRLHAIAQEMERIAAGLPARTTLGRRMKEMTL